MTLLVAPSFYSSESYTSFDANREQTSDIVDNQSGIVKINSTSEVKVDTNNQFLVNTTNNVDSDADVTLTLDGSVLWDVSSTGTDSKTVTLAPDEDNRFKVDVGSASTGNATYYIESKDGSFTFNQTRSVKIASGGLLYNGKTEVLVSREGENMLFGRNYNDSDFDDLGTFRGRATDDSVIWQNFNELTQEGNNRSFTYNSSTEDLSTYYSQNGSLAWEATSNNCQGDAEAVYGPSRSNLYVTGDNCVEAYSSDGTRIWSYTPTSNPRRNPIDVGESGDRNLVVIGDDGEMNAYNTEESPLARLAWTQTNLSWDSIDEMRVENNSVIFISKYDGTISQSSEDIYSYSEDDGSFEYYINFSRLADDPDSEQEFAQHIGQEQIYVAVGSATTQNDVIAINIDSGDIAWQRNYTGDFQIYVDTTAANDEMEVTQDRLYVRTDNQSIAVLDKYNGDLIKIYEASEVDNADQLGTIRDGIIYYDTKAFDTGTSQDSDNANCDGDRSC